MEKGGWAWRSMSLECVQLLNTFISRESLFIKLFEDQYKDRVEINEVLDRLTACVQRHEVSLVCQRQ